jgi:hypothetical protein
MTLEHFQSIHPSENQLDLTRDQLIHITMENKIVSLRSDQKSNILDREQLCALINQNNQPILKQKPLRTTQSNDELSHMQQRVYLNVEQIFTLAKNSNITLDQMATCVTERANVSDTIQDSLSLTCVLVYRQLNFGLNQNN